MSPQCPFLAVQQGGPSGQGTPCPFSDYLGTFIHLVLWGFQARCHHHCQLPHTRLIQEEAALEFGSGLGAGGWELGAGVEKQAPRPPGRHRPEARPSCLRRQERVRLCPLQGLQCLRRRSVLWRMLLIQAQENFLQVAGPGLPPSSVTGPKRCPSPFTPPSPLQTSAGTLPPSMAHGHPSGKFSLQILAPPQRL